MFLIWLGVTLVLKQHEKLIYFSRSISCTTAHALPHADSSASVTLYTRCQLASRTCRAGSAERASAGWETGHSRSGFHPWTCQTPAVSRGQPWPPELWSTHRFSLDAITSRFPLFVGRCNVICCLRTAVRSEADGFNACCIYFQIILVLLSVCLRYNII